MAEGFQGCGVDGSWVACGCGDFSVAPAAGGSVFIGPAAVNGPAAV